MPVVKSVAAAPTRSPARPAAAVAVPAPAPAPKIPATGHGAALPPFQEKNLRKGPSETDNIVQIAHLYKGANKPAPAPTTPLRLEPDSEDSDLLSDEFEVEKVCGIHIKVLKNEKVGYVFYCSLFAPVRPSCVFVVLLTLSRACGRPENPLLHEVAKL